MKKFFYVVLVAAVLFAAKSCDKDPDPKPEPEPYVPPVVNTEDTSGYGTIYFVNTDIPNAYYKVWVDNVQVGYWKGDTTFCVDSIKAGIRILFAEQQSGNPPTELAKTKADTLKILTDSVYTWRFP